MEPTVADTRTPKTVTVLHGWLTEHTPYPVCPGHVRPPMQSLAAHDRETAARAWDEGFHSAEEQHDGYTGVSGWTNNNPYREGD